MSYCQPLFGLCGQHKVFLFSILDAGFLTISSRRDNNIVVIPTSASYYSFIFIFTYGIPYPTASLFLFFL